MKLYRPKFHIPLKDQDTLIEATVAFRGSIYIWLHMFDASSNIINAVSKVIRQYACVLLYALSELVSKWWVTGDKSDLNKVWL